MASWIWVLIPLVAIMKMMNRSRQNEQEVDDIRKLVDSLKTRIENLEAIAAGDPEEFSAGAGKGMEEIEVDEQQIKEENKQEVSNIANNRKTK